MHIDNLLTSKKALTLLALFSASGVACLQNPVDPPPPNDELAAPGDGGAAPDDDDEPAQGGNAGGGGMGGAGGAGGGGGALPEATGEPLWSEAYGAAQGNGTQQTHVEGMATDAAGNVVVVGTFRGVVSFGGDNLVAPQDTTDMFVARYDANGQHVWSRDFSTNMSNQVVQPRDIAIDAAGDLVIVGRYTGLAGVGPNFGGGSLSHEDGDEMFVVKLDAAGDHVWSMAVTGSGHQRANAVAIDAAGNAVVVGEDADDALIVSTNGGGTLLSSATYGDDEDQRATDVAADPAGGVIVVGEHEGAIDLGGGALVSAGFDDVFVVRFDAAGAHDWSAGYGDPQRQREPRVAIGAAGNILLTGSFDGTIDFGGGVLDSEEGAFKGDIFVATLASDGTHVWSASFGGEGPQTPHAIATDAYDRVVVAGGFNGDVDFGGGVLTSAGQDDMFVVKLDADGEHLWSHAAGDSFDQESQAVAIGADEQVFVAGKILGDMAFPGTDPISDLGGGFAIFVAAFAQ